MSGLVFSHREEKQQTVSARQKISFYVGQQGAHCLPKWHHHHLAIWNTAVCQNFGPHLQHTHILTGKLWESYLTSRFSRLGKPHWTYSIQFVPARFQQNLTWLWCTCKIRQKDGTYIPTNVPKFHPWNPDKVGTQWKKHGKKNMKNRDNQCNQTFHVWMFSLCSAQEWSLHSGCWPTDSSLYFGIQLWTCSFCSLSREEDGTPNCDRLGFHAVIRSFEKLKIKGLCFCFVYFHPMYQVNIPVLMLAAADRKS